MDRNIDPELESQEFNLFFFRGFKACFVMIRDKKSERDGKGGAKSSRTNRRRPSGSACKA
jgi:hypothetical protein